MDSEGLELTQVSTATQLPSSLCNVYYWRAGTILEDHNYLNTAARWIYRCYIEQLSIRIKISTSQSFKGPFFKYSAFEECSSFESAQLQFKFVRKTWFLKALNAQQLCDS